MSVKSLLLWEKWRPKTMEDVILLPRIRKHFEFGINQNFIFYGHFGTGKTSLARILIGKYTKDKPYLELNSSLYTSIDVLRSEIEDFCKFTPMMETDSDIKYIFLDEFERVSAQFQDAFKAFIEKYNKNVRFIITTNHLNKISDGIKSRIPQINFEVQNYLETGSLGESTSNVSNKVKLDLYSCIYDKSMDYEKIYHFLMINFGAEKIDVMIRLLGKPFIDWSISENKNIDKLFECNFIISDYSSKLETNTDPIVLGLTIVGKLRDILL